MLLHKMSIEGLKIYALMMFCCISFYLNLNLTQTQTQRVRYPPLLLKGLITFLFYHFL